MSPRALADFTEHCLPSLATIGTPIVFLYLIASRLAELRWWRLLSLPLFIAPNILYQASYFYSGRFDPVEHFTSQFSVNLPLALLPILLIKLIALSIRDDRRFPQHPALPPPPPLPSGGGGRGSATPEGEPESHPEPRLSDLKSEI